MIPHIPSYFIHKYTRKNDLILDPFCGSGTTLLEARLLGRNAIGLDINPLAVLISDVKSNTLDIAELSQVKQSLENTLQMREVQNPIPSFPNIDYWFCEKAKKELALIKHALDGACTQDRQIKKFLQVCFSAIIRKSSFADPRMAKTYRSKFVVEKIQKGWNPAPLMLFRDVLNSNFERMKVFCQLDGIDKNSAIALHGDAKEMEAILRRRGIAEVDFILTSPPYINAQDYFRSYKLEIWWLELAGVKEVRRLNRQAIGTEIVSELEISSKVSISSRELTRILSEVSRTSRKKSLIIRKYFVQMATVLQQCNAVLKKEGHFCLMTGNNTICGINIPTNRILDSIAQQLGLFPVEKKKNRIQHRTLSPKRNHNAGYIREERMTVFKKN